ncbi:MAG: haloacid dehalogenase-like hydrolase [Halioglobus sp.]
MAIEGDLSTVAKSGMKGLMQLLMASHANMSAKEFADSVADWVQTERHLDTGLRYTEMVYQPMLELLDYLRANDFKVYIVSGGGIEFMRVFAEEVYGVVPEQVIGSSIKTTYKVVYGKPTLVRLPEMNFVDDKV